MTFVVDFHNGFVPVSYTHLDVYKRQDHLRDTPGHIQDLPRSAITELSSAFAAFM